MMMIRKRIKIIHVKEKSSIDNNKYNKKKKKKNKKVKIRKK